MPSPATVDKFVRRSSEIFAERCEKYNFRVSVGWLQSERLELLRVFLFDSCNLLDVFLLLSLMRWLECEKMMSTFFVWCFAMAK